jgi:hypothetical protein
VLSKHIDKLLDDLDMDESDMSKKNDGYLIELDEDMSVFLQELSPIGLAISAKIADYPGLDSEELLTNMLSGVLFGSQTAGGVIALDEAGKTLTLNIELPYDVSYQEFYSHVESLFNYVDYWKAEIERLTNETPQGSKDLLY